MTYNYQGVKYNKLENIPPQAINDYTKKIINESIKEIGFVFIDDYYNINCTDCNNCTYCIHCYKCNDCKYCYNCDRCNGCYGCYECISCDNLKDKNYHVRNREVI